MFNALTGLGWGLVSFAVVVGVGSVILWNFGASQAGCQTAICGADGFLNKTTANTCSNITNGACLVPTNTAYTNIYYLTGQLGTTGLAGWTPAIIAVSVGMLLLGMFMIGKGGRNY